MEQANVNVMNMSIIELVRKVNLSSYKVDLDFQAIHVAVTHNPDIVRLWISMLAFAIRHVTPENLVVGVWVEWTRNKRRSEQRNWYQKLDILQLCVGEHCLIYQIRHANGDIPKELLEFVGDNRFTFVGVGIHRIAEILNSDYEIRFGERIVDLNNVFATKRMVQNTYGLRELMNSVLGKDYVRPKVIHMSNWDDLVMYREQILFACANAYICFLIGRDLEAGLLKLSQEINAFKS